MKTIGVLGGFGPQATMDFEARVHRVAQRLLPPKWNAGYPPAEVAECLERRGIACETAEAERRDALDRAIFQVMEGRDDAESTAAARGAVAQLRARDVQEVILGCTEIPLLLGESVEAADLINPAQLLAEAAVRAAIT